MRRARYAEGSDGTNSNIAGWSSRVHLHGAVLFEALTRGNGLEKTAHLRSDKRRIWLKTSINMLKSSGGLIHWRRQVHGTGDAQGAKSAPPVAIGSRAVFR